MQTLELQQQKQETKLSKVLAEDCFQITPATFCRSLLQPIDNPFSDDNIGKYGDRILRKNGTRLQVNYQVDLELWDLFLQFSSPESKIGGWQHIQLDAVPSNLNGERPFFRCDCGRRANKLYMPFVSKKRWLCAKCHNITWRVKQFNRRTAPGAMGYFLDRHLQLQEKESRVKRIDYGGRLTRRARSVIRLVKKWSPGFMLGWGTREQPQKVPAHV